MKKTLPDRIIVLIIYSLLILYTLLCLLPLVMAVSVSFSDETVVGMKGYSLLPQHPSLDTYRFLLYARFKMLLNAYGVTIFVTVIGMLLSVVVTTAYAYVVSVKEFKNRNKLAFFAYFTMIFNGGLLPWYVICTKYYHLSDSIWGLIIPYTMNVFLMYLMRNYFSAIPTELIESARMDGAGHFIIFTRIMMPLAKVGMVTIALYYGLGYWNDFYLPLMFITKESLFTVQYLLYNMMANITFLATSTNVSMTSHVSIPLLTARMAMTCIAIGPIILLYPFAQRYFIKGIIIGAIKG